ncbi:MAG: serine protease [Patescibacteria group bacterium]
MFKNYKIILIFLSIALFFAIAPKAKATNIYPSIVKIYTYAEDRGYNLDVIQSGSGVVISSDGVILTNYHVINIDDIFNEELPVAFKICFTGDTTEKPDCAFSADLIAKDKDNDLALLKMRNLGLTAQSSFDYIERAKKITYEDDDIVQVLGYPAIGGETITSTYGTILGTIKKYSFTWIKTNALISFGSSGGALLDLDGYLLGITSAKISDIGYAIDIIDINDWIDSNINKEAQVSALQGKMSNFITTQYNLKNKNIFINTLPNVQITKPYTWQFSYENEDYLYLNNLENLEGGEVSVSWIKSDTDADVMLDVTVKGMLLTDNYFSAGDITLGGKTGKKLISHSNGEEIQYAILPSKNYFITVTYYYGKNNVDKGQVDSILDSIRITDENNNFVEQRVYEHDYPYFKISLPNSWSLLPNRDVGNPVDGQKRSVPEIGWGVYVRELTDTMQNMSKSEYFDYIKDTELIRTDLEDRFNFKAVRYYESLDYKINNDLTSEIFYKYRFKDEEDNDKIKMYAAGYRILDNDRVIVIEFSYLSEDEAKFEQYLKDFQNEVLVNFKTNKSSGSVSTESNNQSTVSLSAKNIINIGKRLIGRIILQVESNGEAWYLCPDTNKAHFLGRPADAFQVMRELGLGISEESYNSFNGYAPARLAGKILLRVEANGEAYYVNPVDNKMHYLGRPDDAFQVMRILGLGVSNTDFNNL